MAVTAVLVAGALPLVARVVFLLLLDGDRDKDDSTGRLIPPPRWDSEGEGIETDSKGSLPPPPRWDSEGGGRDR